MSISPLSSLTNALGSGSSSSSNSSSSSAAGGTGLGQGIDIQQFVQFAVANQQATITSLQNQQNNLTAQQSELGTITSQFLTLESAAYALKDPLGAMSAETASSSNSSMLTASASYTATPSSHTVSISNLATTSSYYTDSVATSSTALASGDTINISVGGTSVAGITIDSTNNTLGTLATAINTATSAVHASVVTDANGSRLALVSASSGAPGDIAVTGSLHLTDANNTAVKFNQAVQGKNANLFVDGMPVSSTSNTVSGVIEGVVLNLAAPTVTNGVDNPVSLTVAPDTTQATTAINNFVNAYNAVTTEINNQFKVGANGAANGVLEADSSLRQAQSMLLGAASYAMTGNNGIVNLASIGVNMNDDGTLTVDKGALSSALSSNYSAVQNLMQNSINGFGKNFDQMVLSLDLPSTGLLAIDGQSITSLSNDIGQRITDLQAAMVVQEAQFTAIYSKVNTTLQQLPMLMAQMSQQLSSIP